jgi:hypothetical protein
MQKYLKIGYYLQEIKITINMKIYSFPGFYLPFLFTKRLPRTSKTLPPDYFIFNIVITILTSMMQI